MWATYRLRCLSRHWAARRSPPGPLREFLSAPLPSPDTLVHDCRIMAIDLETTGLDPRRDRILSVGLVPIAGMRIELGAAWQTLLRAERLIPEETVVIHQITDARAAAGALPEHVLPELLQRLAGHVLLAHHASTERAFLDASCRRLYGGRFIAPFIDTEELARRRQAHRGVGIRHGELRLFNLRESFNLPRYKAHHALSDAIATAELFLALVNEFAPEHEQRLGRFISP